MYKVFVGNRVSKIQEPISLSSWFWIPTAENPADIPSRGIHPLKNPKQKNFWLHGPEFLKTGILPEQPKIGKITEEL